MSKWSTEKLLWLAGLYLLEFAFMFVVHHRPSSNPALEDAREGQELRTIHLANKESGYAGCHEDERKENAFAAKPVIDFGHLDSLPGCFPMSVAGSGSAILLGLPASPNVTIRNSLLPFCRSL